MASVNVYTVSDTVGVRLAHVSRAIVITVGDSEIRLSPDEFRYIVETTKELLSENAAACAELGL
ncbi:hypothetical protein [Rhodococcus sp. MALMAid1271]|uniref:hypothetical protein n=1 Tax=Rhodococcus sp. MALMAid1271 TaxID=3411744 RepID=UPI003B9E7A7E